MCMKCHKGSLSKSIPHIIFTIEDILARSANHRNASELNQIMAITLSYGKLGNGFSAHWYLIQTHSGAHHASGNTKCLPSIKAVMNEVILEAWNHAQ